MTWVGKKLVRFEDAPLVRGEGCFVADCLDHAKHVRFVRSPIANGRILEIAKPQGELVITAEDLQGVGAILPQLHSFNYVPVAQPILAQERVYYVGQAIAAVVAETAAAAEDLAESVLVDIDPEPPLISIDDALAPGAGHVHAGASGNVLVEGRLATNDFDQCLSKADAIVELSISSARQNATPLETRGGAAAFDRSTKRVRLAASVQMPHMLRTGIADCLGMPEADLQVIAPDVGGAFGQKMSLFPEYVMLVWLARKFRRSFAWVEDRRENLIASAHGRDQVHHLRGAFGRDGTLVALGVDILANVGAFSCYPVTCAVEPLMALAEYPGPYRFSAFQARARGISTHTCPIAPYRGVSRPIITFGFERLMELAAKQLGIDALELRQRNLVTTFPYRTPTGLVLDSASYQESLDRAVERSNLDQFRARQMEARKKGRYIGVGFAVINERTGYGTPAFSARAMDITPGYETVDVAFTPSGEVEVRIGASPHGQGLRTALTQIVADELGVTPDDVRVIHGDTDKTPYGWGTFASRSAVISGGATQLASRKLADQVRLVAARLLQCHQEDVVLKDGVALGGSQAVVSLREIARKTYHRSDQVADLIGCSLSASASYDPSGTFSNACHVAFVEVDIETGGVQITRYLVVEDAGLLINPAIADGQIHGGVTQGIAQALFEAISYSGEGNILTTSLADYLVPTVSEIPSIEVEHLVSLSPATQTGAKGLGEGGAIGAPGAVVNAICDALSPFGVELFDLPATPERILRALRKNAGSRA